MNPLPPIPPLPECTGDSDGRLCDLLTLAEVAALLRCSKAHICNLVNGRVKNVPRLPVVAVGRRKLVRRRTLELWKIANEHGSEIDDIIRRSEKNTVDAWKEEFHA